MDVGAHESRSKASGTEATSKASKREGLKRKMAGGLKEVAGDQKSTSSGSAAAATEGRRVTPRHDPYLPWPIDGVVVDEQMSWGSLWIPCWDVDFLGEDYHRALFDDDVLYDDIWNLRSINKIPRSLEGRRESS